MLQGQGPSPLALQNWNLPEAGNAEQFSSKRQFGHNDDRFIGQGVASHQVLSFPCVLVFLPLNNLPSEDCTFR